MLADVCVCKRALVVRVRAAAGQRVTRRCQMDAGVLVVTDREALE